MSLKSRFIEIFGPAWNEAEHLAAGVAHDAEAIVHFVEKEIEVIPQNIADALARIKNQGANDAKTISDLKAEVADVQGKLDAATQQLTDVSQARDDAVQQLSDIEAAVLDAAPPAAA